jgi:molecular chaperone GrpE
MSDKKKKNVPPAAEPVPETAAEPETAEAEPAPAPEAEPQTTEADAQAEQIKALEAKLQETKDQLMRTLAEYDNYRKRLQKEKDARYNDGKADAVLKLLPVADNLERAVAADGDAESYKKGVEMTLKQLADSLSALGVEAFGEKGEPFDPNLHNGVMHEDNEELPENCIAEVFMKGYRIGDRVIRHATVKVAN